MPKAFRPIVPFTAIYVLGLLLLRASADPLIPLYTAAALFGLLVIATARWNRPLGLAVALLSVGALILLWRARFQGPGPQDISRFAGLDSPLPRGGGAKGPSEPQAVTVYGSIAEEPELGRTSVRAVVDCHRVHKGARQAASTGRLMLYLPLSETMPLLPEDLVAFTAVVRQPSEGSNPGQFSSRRYLANLGIFATASLDKASQIERRGRASGWRFQRWCTQLRRRISGNFSDTMPRRYGNLAAKLLCSIVFGNRVTPLPPVLEKPFQESGTIHILVVSGAQVGLLVLFLLAVSGSRRRIRPVIAVAVLGVVWFYATLTGSPPSVVRAAVMASSALLAFVIGREPDRTAALCAAALVILVVNPPSLYDVGFQLSFAAVVGLLLIEPRLRQWLSPLPRPLAVSLSASAAAQLMVWPILAYYFGKVSPIALLANIPVVLLSGVLVATGGLACLLGFFQPLLAHLLNLLNYKAVLWTLWTARAFAEVPHACITTSSPSPLSLALYYLVLLSFASLATERVRQWITRERVFLAVLCAVTVAAVWLTYHHGRRELRVTILDVGEGDCIVVEGPRRNLLIDGGSYSTEEQERDVGHRVILPYLLCRGITRLDAVVVTHPHEDHVSGLPSVLEELEVGMILTPHLSAPVKDYEQLLAKAWEHHIPVKEAQRGQRLDLGNGAQLYVLAPSGPLFVGTPSDLNNNSMVTKLMYGKVGMLFAGDIEAAAEVRLLASGDSLGAAVLKVAHHGSGSSTSEEFLKAVHPQVAIISCGNRNLFEHPHPETQTRLLKVGARLYRTDACGAVTVRTDGNGFEVQTFKD